MGSAIPGLVTPPAPAAGSLRSGSSSGGGGSNLREVRPPASALEMLRPEVVYGWGEWNLFRFTSALYLYSPWLVLELPETGGHGSFLYWVDGQCHVHNATPAEELAEEGPELAVGEAFD